MQIGSFIPRNPFFLAPMAGITDWPFRLLCVEQGAGLVYTEMANARALHYQDPDTLRITQTQETERPCAVQVFGHEPDLIAEAVRYFLTRPDIALIDINMGCPTPKIVKNGDGSILLTNPKRVQSILMEAVKAAEGQKPVTVKIRKGWDESSINYLDIGRIAEDAGISAIALHGRTREQMYSGNADWESIRQLKQTVSIPIIGNGDVKSLEDGARMMAETGCDAVMIGRAAQGNPWVFSQVSAPAPDAASHACVVLPPDAAPPPVAKQPSNAILPPHPAPPSPLPRGGSLEILLQTIYRHHDMMVEYKGERTALLEMRKHIAWYLHGLKDAHRIRTEVYMAEDVDSVKQILGRLFPS